MPLESTLEMRIRIRITIVLSLMTIVIVGCVGPLTALPRNYYGALGWGIPWLRGWYFTSERRDQREWRDEPLPEPSNPEELLDQLDDLERMRDTFPHSLIEGTVEECLDPTKFFEPENRIDKANENPAESNRKMGYYRGKERDEGAKLKEPYCPIWPASNSFTLGSPPQILCQSGRPPSRPQPTKHTDVPKIPAESTHPTKSSNCRKKSKLLSPEETKMILEIILDTKQHVLSTLKILNIIEYEVLGHSPENCPFQEPRVNAPKKIPERLEPLEYPTWQQSQLFPFGPRPTSQSKSAYVLAIEEELNRLWDEPKYHTPARRPIIRNKSRKHRYHRQKKQPKMKMMAPSMVAILC